jgi:hypothetical protein
MTKRLLAALSLSALVLLAPAKTTAQPSGVAFATFGSTSDIFAGFFGPWRPTATGLDFLLNVLCYNLAETPRRKVANLVTVSVPDGQLGQISSLATTAVVQSCADNGVTVPRTAVLLPVLQPGQ